MRALLCATLLGAAAAGAQTFDLQKGALTYTVTTKLHEVKGTSHDLEGRALVQPDGSLKVQVRAKVATFDSGNSNRDEHMREVTHEPAHPYVQVKGTASGVRVPISSPQDVELSATLDFNGVQRPEQVKVHLEPQQGGLVRATFSFPFSLESFQVQRPQLLFVTVDDTAHIDGDLLFAGARQ